MFDRRFSPRDSRAAAFSRATARISRSCRTRLSKHPPSPDGTRWGLPNGVRRMAKSPAQRSPAAVGWCSTAPTRMSLFMRRSAVRESAGPACCCAPKRPRRHEGNSGVAGRRRLAAYRVTMDAHGKETSRERLRYAGGQNRIAPPPDPNAAGRGGAGRARTRRAAALPPNLPISSRLRRAFAAAIGNGSRSCWTPTSCVRS